MHGLHLTCTIIIMIIIISCVIIVMYSGDGESDENEELEPVRSFHPVVCMGRQPNSDVYIIGPSLQFGSDGSAIRSDEQTYLWVPRVIQKLRLNNIMHPIQALPAVSQPVNQLFEGLHCLTGNNFPSSIFVVGKHA